MKNLTLIDLKERIYALTDEELNEIAKNYKEQWEIEVATKEDVWEILKNADYTLENFAADVRDGYVNEYSIDAYIFWWE